MPIFEYRCESCGTKFEKLIRRAADEQALACPSCGTEKIEKELSTFSAHANGRPADRALPPCGASCPTPGLCSRN